VIFDHATILTINPAREIIYNGAVVVEGRDIVAVGRSTEIREQFSGQPVIDCNGNVLMPGLIDTHVHTAQAMLRGCADDLTLLDWLGKRVWVLQGSYTEEDGRASAALCALEMIKSGTTSFIECMLAERYGFDGVAETIAQSGMRAAIGKIIMDQPSYGKVNSFMHPGLVEDGETSIRNTLAAYDKWNGAADGRIQVWFGPRTPGGVTPAVYDQISQLARDRNMYHNSQFRGARRFGLCGRSRLPVGPRLHPCPWPAWPTDGSGSLCLD
jgi:cytosine/adenosine deaminase-related metal-dependent hydrolase